MISWLRPDGQNVLATGESDITGLGTVADNSGEVIGAR